MLDLSTVPVPAWLALATAGWYVSARVIGVSGGRDAPSAIIAGLTLPTAATCAAAIEIHHPEAAIGVTLASSVAALTLVLGLVGTTHPISSLVAAPRSWLFLLPTALIVLLIGFSGEIRLSHALVLILQGVAVLTGTASWTRRESSAPATTGLRIAAVGVAMLTIFVSSLLAVYAADWISRDLQQSGSGLIAAVMLSPALVLPMIGVTTRLAGERRPLEAVGLIVAAVQINLCLLLPLSSIAWLLQPNVLTTLAKPQHVAPTTQSTTAPVAADAIHFAFPISVWRIDTTLVLVAGVVLFLLALGRLQLGRVEATALILLYVAYLMVTAAAAR